MSRPIDIDRISQLANLEIPEAERQAVAADFESVVALIDKLAGAKANELPVTNQVTDLENVYRQDDVVHFPHHRTIVELAPSSQDGLVKVPGVFVEGRKDEE